METRLGHFGAARRWLTEEAVNAVSAAEAYLGLFQGEGAAEDRAAALAQARIAHEEAAGDGEPWVDRWRLTRATAVFTALGEAPPPVPVYDETTDAPIPYEAEIRAWVDELNAAKAAGKAAAND